jgi:hypothetical protein
MAQNSRPMPDNCASYPTSDAGPYSGDEWRERIALPTVGDENTSGERAQLRGVLPTVWDKLVVTNPSGKNIVVDNGAAIVNGNVFVHDPNDAPTSITFQPTTPAANRIDKVVVVLNNTNVTYNTNLEFPTDLTDYNATSSVEPYSVRLAILTGVVGGAARALVQTTNYWMIEIARYTINNVGTIASGPDDYREFANIEKVVGVHSDDDDQIEDALILGVMTDDSVGGGVGMGVSILFKIEDDLGNYDEAARIAARWTDANSGSEDSRFEFRTVAGAVDNLSCVIESPATASAADGNQRGSGAVDLQGYRAAAAEVAAGDFSVIGGGQENQIGASNDHCVISGGEDNVISGAGDNNTIGGGINNSIAGDEATVAGGNLNTIAAGSISGTVGGGGTNTITAGTGGTIAGGFNNTITDGDGATISGGGYNELDADYATIPGGLEGSVDLYGQVATASGHFAADGDAQGTIQMVARTTTAGGGAATTLYLDGAAQRMTVPASSAWTYDILVIAISQNAGAIHSSRAYGLIERDNANNTTLVSATGVVVEQAAGCTTTVTADNVNEALQIQFTDDGVSVFRVVATIRLAQVTYP